MTPEFAISILLAERAEAMTPPEQEQFCVARDQLARELAALARKSGGMLSGKLDMLACGVSLAKTPRALQRLQLELDDALLQARREGVLPHASTS